MRHPAAIRRFALASLSLCPAAVGGCTSSGDSAPRGEDSVAISAAANDLDGRPVDPLVQSAGRVVVLTFVRADCPISNRYAPTLREIQGRFAPRGVCFYLVYPDPHATPDEIRGHVAQYDFGMPPLLDPDHALVKLARATVTPEAAVFDRRGKLVYRGRIDDRHVEFGKSRPAPTTHDLEDAIAAALANETVPVTTTEAVGCFIADLK
jgi:hypothetical protein